MNKSSLILQYFQKRDQLTVKNPDYCSTLNNLFAWLVENDKTGSDITARLLNLKSKTTARITSREEGVIAGLEEISYLIKTYTTLSFKPLTTDGKTIKNGQTISNLKGNAFEILSVERTILNILQRMSGIATETNRLIESLKTFFPYLAATRKTPWMQLDKKAVAVGGGLTHRLNLADGILIKDNHLKVLQKQYKLKTIEEAIAKSLEEAIKTPRGWPAYKDSPGVEESEKPLIEIEVETPHQAYLVMEKALKTLEESVPLAIMFDNFSPDQVKAILSSLSDLERNQIVFEASGGITEKNISEWAKTGVDIISIGALTHSPKAINLSLEI